MDLQPGPAPCLPGRACQPGAVVQAELVALDPQDARDALLAIRLLDQVELDLDAARDREAQLRASLASCGQRDECPPVATPEGWGERWLGRAGWLLSGVAVGMGVGLATSLVWGR